jgi:hypothetical protein
MQLLCIMLILWIRTISVHVIFLSDVNSEKQTNFIQILNAGLKN